MTLGMLSWSMAKVQDMIFIAKETATSPDTSETFQNENGYVLLEKLANKKLHLARIELATFSVWG